MQHPEYVHASGKAFLSRWGEESLRKQIEIYERALRDISHERAADPSMAARRALKDAERTWDEISHFDELPYPKTAQRSAVD